jgi:hypothetical protein
VALIIKMILRGQLRRVIINLILVSILFLFVIVRINIISNKYTIRMKAEDIQFFACKKRIHPIVVVEETRMIPLAVVIVKRWRTEYIVPKASKDNVLGFISCNNIKAAGNF